MEIGGAGEVRRNGRVISTGTSGGKKNASASAMKHNQARADRIALSSAAVRYLEEQNRRIQEEAQKRESDASGDSAKLNLLKKGLKSLNKCQKIYARVVNGDKVPPEDLRYLEENDPEGYKMALAMRKPNKHPKEWKSVLDEEDKSASSEGTPAAPAESGGAEPSGAV